jgi:polyhydroxyalkanoate synthesis regulator phasin
VFCGLTPPPPRCLPSSALEVAQAESAETTANIARQVVELYAANEQTQALARRLVKETREALTAEAGELKEEMQHKFSLQAAENKRLQSHLTTLKNENQALERRVVALEKRVKFLEQEMVGEDFGDSGKA